jgi:hypothetical protein
MQTEIVLSPLAKKTFDKLDFATRRLVSVANGCTKWIKPPPPSDLHTNVGGWSATGSEERLQNARAEAVRQLAFALQDPGLSSQFPTHLDGNSLALDERLFFSANLLIHDDGSIDTESSFFLRVTLARGVVSSRKKLW